MSTKTLTLLQEVYFDLCALLNSGQMDDFSINGFQEFDTLREFLEEQKTKIKRIESTMEIESCES
jgi:hypothetical protein